MDSQCGSKNSKSSSDKSATSGQCTEVSDVDLSSASFVAETESTRYDECEVESNIVIGSHPTVAKTIINSDNKSPCGKYVCELCSKTFQAYANLKQHKTTHENDKKFACVLCAKKFKRISGLNQHIRGFHYKIKPFSCPICTYNYALKGDMLRCRHSSLKKDGSTH